MSEKFSANRALDRVKGSWAIFQKDLVGYGLMIFLGSLVAGITGGILSGPIMIGFFKGARKQMAGEKVEVKDGFSGMSKFGPAFMTSLALGVVSAGIAAVFGILFAIFLLVHRVQVLYPLLMVIWGIALFAVCVAFAVIAPVVYIQSLLFISEEDLSFMDAIKKSVAWVRANISLGLEFYLSNLICGLAAFIPVVGGIAASGLSTLNAVLYYDGEKEAGRL